MKSITLFSFAIATLTSCSNSPDIDPFAFGVAQGLYNIAANSKTDDPSEMIRDCFEAIKTAKGDEELVEEKHYSDGAGTRLIVSIERRNSDDSPDLIKMKLLDIKEPTKYSIFKFSLFDIEYLDISVNGVRFHAPQQIGKRHEVYSESDFILILFKELSETPYDLL